jgi:hypothetical protein
MSSVNEVVFALSPLATATLRNGEAGISPRLLTLLMLIDGVTPVAQYEPFLKSFHPLEEKFLELEEHGYLVRMGAVSPRAVQTFNANVAAGKPVSELRSIDSLMADSGFVSLPDDQLPPDLRLNRT